MNEVLESYVQERIAEAMSDSKQVIEESFALKMLKAGEALTKVVEYSGLSMTAVKRLAKTLKAEQ